MVGNLSGFYTANLSNLRATRRFCVSRHVWPPSRLVRQGPSAVETNGEPRRCTAYAALRCPHLRWRRSRWPVRAARNAAAPRRSQEASQAEFNAVHADQKECTKMVLSSRSAGAMPQRRRRPRDRSCLLAWRRCRISHWLRPLGRAVESAGYRGFGRGLSSRDHQVRLQSDSMSLDDSPRGHHRPDRLRCPAFRFRGRGRWKRRQKPLGVCHASVPDAWRSNNYQ
jgi:hypothetical protein